MAISPPRQFAGIVSERLTDALDAVQQPK